LTQIGLFIAKRRFVGFVGSLVQNCYGLTVIANGVHKECYRLIEISQKNLMSEVRRQYRGLQPVDTRAYRFITVAIQYYIGGDQSIKQYREKNGCDKLTSVFNTVGRQAFEAYRSLPDK
jgi:hypothetical protein